MTMRDAAWQRVFNETLISFSNEVHIVKEQAIVNLLALGASLADLEWDGAGDLIHKPTGFGYHFRMETGDTWIQYIAEPTVKR